MAPHSSILAWEILWTEEPGGLQSRGCKSVTHNLATKQQQFHSMDVHSFFICSPVDGLVG